MDKYPYATHIRFTPSPVLFPAHYIGDRVERPRNVYAPIKQWDMMYGVVILRYAMWDRFQADFLRRIVNDYPELYAIRWDSGKFEKGFLPHGISKIGTYKEGEWE